MSGKISVWAAGAALAGLMLPSEAMAQYDAQTRADLNLRVGPGTEYGVIDVIPAGYPVDVLGCLDAYEWCDIEWDGLRGWVSARYLAQPNTGVYLPQYAPRIGVPIISFSFGTYHDRYYRDRPWHRERHGHWTDRDWRDRDGRDRDDDGDRRRGDGDRDEARDRDRDEAQERQEAEQREERREAQEREARREAEQQRQQRDAERPESQQREARPQQQREREAQPQQREREARPEQGERSQRQGNRPQQGQRVQRRGNGGPPEELTNDRGQ